MKKQKGFTLTELIVVIVIIAILVAALTPAILGVINRANRAADEADARTMMIAASTAASMRQPAPGIEGVNLNNMRTAFGLGYDDATASTGLAQGTYIVHFRGPVAIGARIINGGRLGPNNAAVTASNQVVVGTAPVTPPAGTRTVTITVGADGHLASGAVSSPSA